MSEWSIVIDEDGDLALELYKGKGNCVTICLSAKAHVINWAALVDGVPHHGCIKGFNCLDALDEVKHRRLIDDHE